MRPSPTRIVWSASGSIAQTSCVKHTGPCFVCVANMTRGMLVQDWMGSNFTDQNRARCLTATHVCEACVYVHSRIAPVPGRPAKDGKKFGGNFRNYSHLWEDGWESPAFGDDGTRCAGYVNASKGEKPLIREFLALQHAGSWFAAIADSGQKHVLPFAPMNGPGRRGRVLFDELLVTIPDDQRLLGDSIELLTAGATKDEILSGDYRATTYDRCSAAVIEFERTHAGERGSGWFALAVWLAQRDEEQVATRLAAEKEAKSAKRARPRKAENPDGGSASGRKGSVSARAKSERTKALGTAPDENAERRADDIEPRGVVQPTLPELANTGRGAVGQLGLFGADEPSPRPERGKRVARDGRV